MNPMLDKNEWKKPQTWLSVSRIPLSLVMLNLATVDKWWFLGVLLLISLTDLLDGIVARARNEASPNGAWFDSVADHFFYPLLFVSTYLLAPQLFKNFWQPVTLLVLWWIGNFILMRIRWRKTVFIHLNTVRLSVLVYVIFAVLLVMGIWVETAFVITIIIFSLRMAEETVTYSFMDKNKIESDLRWSWQAGKGKKRKRT